MDTPESAVMADNTPGGGIFDRGLLARLGLRSLIKVFDEAGEEGKGERIERTTNPIIEHGRGGAGRAIVQYGTQEEEEEEQEERSFSAPPPQQLVAPPTLETLQGICQHVGDDVGRKVT